MQSHGTNTLQSHGAHVVSHLLCLFTLSLRRFPGARGAVPDGVPLGAIPVFAGLMCALGWPRLSNLPQQQHPPKKEGVIFLQQK